MRGKNEGKKYVGKKKSVYVDVALSVTHQMTTLEWKVEVKKKKKA